MKSSRVVGRSRPTDVAKPSFVATTPGVKAIAPGVDATTPGVKAIAPGVDTTTPGVEATTPGVKATAPGVEATTPGVKAIAPGVEATTPGVKAIAPGVKAIAPGVDAMTPGVKAIAPGAVASEPRMPRVTWYANRIYVNASPAVIAALREDPIFEGHLFRLRGTLPASWEKGAGKVRLPRGGLVVVKEVGPATDDDGEAEIALYVAFGPGVGRVEHTHDWYAEGEWFSWNQLHGPSDVKVIDPAGLEELAECDVPPRGFLRFLADLHARCGQPVTYYLGRTWGGLRHAEAAWVFAERDVLYCYNPPKDVNADPHDEVVVLDRDGRHVVYGDVLRLALAHHGLHLPTGYFAPHTRTFDWKPWRL
jgi:hypothetical protein